MSWRVIPGVSVIGITGKARAGKDELARAIVRVAIGAERFAYSDAVAAVARAGHMMERRDPSVLQFIGTLYRQANATTWLRCLHGAIEDRRPAIAVITGLRYQNEVDLVRDLGGIVVGVERPGAPALADRDPQHEVESHIGEMLAQADERFSVAEIEDDYERARHFDTLACSVVALSRKQKER